MILSLKVVRQYVRQHVHSLSDDMISSCASIVLKWNFAKVCKSLPIFCLRFLVLPTKAKYLSFGHFDAWFKGSEKQKKKFFFLVLLNLLHQDLLDRWFLNLVDLLDPIMFICLVVGYIMQVQYYPKHISQIK